MARDEENVLAIKGHEKEVAGEIGDALAIRDAGGCVPRAEPLRIPYQFDMVFQAKVANCHIGLRIEKAGIQRDGLPFERNLQTNIAYDFKHQRICEGHLVLGRFEIANCLRLRDNLGCDINHKFPLK